MKTPELQTGVEGHSLDAVVSCEWFTAEKPYRRKSPLVTCGRTAEWKCLGKRRWHYYCPEHRNEFIEAARNREAETRRWSRVAAKDSR